MRPSRVPSRTIDQQPRLHAGALQPGRNGEGDGRFVTVRLALLLPRAGLITKDCGEPAGTDPDFQRLAHEVDSIDESREDFAPCGRCDVGPTAREVGRAGDDLGAVIHSPDHGLDRPVHRCVAVQELPQALLDQAFEVAGWNPAATRRPASVASD
jgi:hypothetical protein